MPHPVDFPRGGSSVLTPLEYRNVADQVMKDSFLEETNSNANDVNTNQSKKKRERPEQQKSKVQKKKKVKTDSSSSANDVQIDMLNLKKLTTQIKMLGAIKDIHEYEMTISLPNGMVGSVSITDISEIITKKLESVAEDPDFDESMLPSLAKMYKIGELVSIVIVPRNLDDENGNENEKSNSSKRKQPLTMNPTMLNTQMNTESIKPGMVLSAVIKSHEDHGCILDFGLETISGFIPIAHIQQLASSSDDDAVMLEEGSVKLFNVESVDQRVIQCKPLNSAVTLADDNIGLASITPGTKLKTVFDAKSEYGISVKLNQILKASVTKDHIGSESEWNGKKKVKKEARVLYVDTQRKKISLSFCDHILNLKPVHFNYSFGSKVNAKPVEFDKKQGLIIVCENDGCKGTVMPSRLPTDKPKAIEKMIASQEKVSARIVGYDYLNGSLALTMDPKILKQEFISYNELTPGQIVKGKINKVSDAGVNLSINDFIHGFIPKIFLSDVTLSNPALKFKIGSDIPCRVMAVEVDKRRMILSSKKSLLESELPIVSSFEDAKQGIITMAVVKSVIQHGMIATFYNNLTAFIPKHEMNAETDYFSGQSVKCRIVHTDAQSGKIKVSLKLKPQEVNVKVKVGSIIQAKVNKKLADSIIFNSVDTKESIMVMKPHISDFKNMIDRKFETLGNEEPVNVLIIAVDSQGRIYGSLKQSIVLYLQQDATSEWKPVHSNYPTVSPAFISKIMDNGCVVQVPSGAKVFVHKKDISDKYVLNVADSCHVGDTVLVKSKTDDDTQRQSGSLRRADILNTSEIKESLAKAYLMTFINDQSSMVASKTKRDVKAELEVGSIITGEVSEIQSYGAILKLDQGRKGLITNEHIEKEFKSGQKVQAQVLDFDSNTKIADLAPWTTKKVKSLTPKSETIYEAKIMLIKDNYMIARIPELKNAVTIIGVVGYNRSDRLQNIFQAHQMVRVKIFESDQPKKNVHMSVLVDSETRSKVTFSGLLRSPFDATLTSISDLKPGKLIQVAFRSMKDVQVNVRISDNFNGRIHASELGSDIIAKLTSLKPGDPIEAKILGFFNSKTHTFLPISHSQGGSMKNLVAELTTRDSDLAKPNMELGNSRETFETLIEGNTYDATVSKIEDKYIFVSLTPTLMGRVSRIDAQHEMFEEDQFCKKFELRQSICVKLLKKNVNAKSLDFSIKEISQPLTEGQLTIGEIKKVNPETGLSVEIANHKNGFVHLTDIDDKYETNPTSRFAVGNIIQVFIKKVTENRKYILSLRPSRVLKGIETPIQPEIPEIESLESLKVGDMVSGYIQSVTDCGAFVAVAPSVSVRVKIADLSDVYIKEFQKEFKKGQLVRGIVKSNEGSKVDISLKMKDIDPSRAPPTTADDLEIGGKYTGKITSIQKYGLFIKLDNSKLSGLCHRSEISDDSSIEDPTADHKVGEQVTVIVLSITEEKKVKLGMKPSYFNCGEMKAIKNKTSNGDAMDVSDDDSDESEVEKSNAVPSLDVGFDWGISQNYQMEIDDSEEDDDELDSEADASGDDDDRQGLSSKSAKKKSKRQKLRELKEQEQKAREIESNQSKEPETADDFERLLLGSPNSSYIWIKYMAFELKLAEIDKARAIAERAIKSINHQDQREKFNVWVAYMNLENAFGTRETLDECFKRAVQLNDAKKMYIQMCTILENSGKSEIAEEYYEQMAKKFRESCKVWIAFGQYYLKKYKPDEFKKVMERSLKSLPQRKHLKAMLKFTQLEFREGSAERGRTMFEGLLSRFPKRIDLWNVYIDLEIKKGNPNMVRRLFERAISLNLSSKKMKFFFKKYLEYEKANGTPEQMEHVKQAAMEYVEKMRS